MSIATFEDFPVALPLPAVAISDDAMENPLVSLVTALRYDAGDMNLSVLDIALATEDHEQLRTAALEHQQHHGLAMPVDVSVVRHDAELAPGSAYVREEKNRVLLKSFLSSVTSGPALAGSITTPADVPMLPPRVGRDGQQLPGVPTVLAYIVQANAFVGKRVDGTTWDIEHPIESIDRAKRVLIAAGYMPGDASDILSNHQLINAFSVDTVPNGPPTLRRGDQTFLNLWVPPTVKPFPGSWPTFEATFRFICGDDDGYGWWLNWLAFIVQNPARRMRTGPIFLGEQNTGKSLAARAARELLGMSNTRTVRTSDIASRFTSSFASSLLVVMSEVEAADVAGVTANLKYLTGESRIQSEAKGASAIEVENHAKFMGVSNQVLPIRLERGDTRWSILRQGEAARPELTARQSALFDGDDWSATGRAELSALMYFCLNAQVDKRMAETPMESEARTQAMEASRGSVEQFVDACNADTLDGVWMTFVPEHERHAPHFARLDVTGWPNLTGKDALYATYRAFCAGSGLQHLGVARFVGELARVAKEWTLRSQRREPAKKGVKNVDDRVRLADGTKVPACFDGVPRCPALRSPLGRALAHEPGVEGPVDHPNVQAAVATLFPEGVAP